MGHRRGFTLLEMMIVAAIVAIGGALAVAYFDRTSTRTELRGLTRVLLANLRSARGLASTGSLVPGLPGGGSAFGFGAGGPARYSGIEFVGPTQYRVFADDDNVAGGEVYLRTVEFTQDHPSNRAQITAPAAGTQLRFNRQGVLLSGAAIVTMRDTSTGEEIDISLTGVGLPRISAMRQ